MNNLIKRVDCIILILLYIIAIFSCIQEVSSSIFLKSAIFLGAVRLGLKRECFYTGTKHIKFVALFFEAYALSIVWNGMDGNLYEGWRILRNSFLFDFGSLLLIIFFVKTEKQNKLMYVLITISFFITSVYALYEYHQGNNRPGGLTEHCMSLAGLLAILYPTYFVLINKINLENKWKCIFGFMSFFGMIILYINSTRGVWLSNVVLFVIICSLAIKSKLKSFFIITMSFMLIISGIAVNDQFKNRLFSICSTSNQSNSERILMWNSAKQIFLDNPILGVGLGNYGDTYLANYRSPLSKEIQGHAHNIYLQVLAETGIIGFSFFILLFGYVLSESYSRYKRDENIYAFMVFIATLGFLLQGITEMNIYNKPSVTRVYWMLMGIYLNLIRLKLYHPK